MQSFLQDLRFAIRQLRKSFGYAATAIFLLALGICANVAIFGFVDAPLIKPLPYHDPSRLVGVFESNPTGDQYRVSYLDYLDWKHSNKLFRSLDAYQDNGFMLNDSAGAQQVGGARVSDGFFRTLGVTPLIGRDFRLGEDLPAAPRTVLLSYSAWQKRYGGCPDILGQTVTLDGSPNVIIGVLPRDFHFAPAEPSEFWATLHASGQCDQKRGCHSLLTVARLNDGVSVPTALAGMKALARQLEMQYPDTNRDQSANVLPLTDVIVGDVRPILLALQSGAGLLLLIACLNVTSLLLARSESRKREIAVREALGASRTRLTRQFLTEGLVLVTIGSTLGTLIAEWTMQLLTRLVPADMMDSMPYLHGLGINLRVAAFAALVSLLAGVLFAITPTLRLWLSGSNMREGLSEGGRTAAGTMWRSFGANLVRLELAIAMVLLVSAGLLGKSFYRLLHVDLGLNASHLATLRVEAPEANYSKNEQLIALERQTLERIGSLPGVKSAGITDRLPIGTGGTIWIQIVGRPNHGEHNEVNNRQVSSGYFTALQAQLLRGRYFNEAEDSSKPPVVIINRTMAKQYFPSEDPIGKQLYFTTPPQPPMQIVGVVADIREGELDTQVRPALYQPFNQDPQNYFSIIVRTSQSEQTLLPALAAVVHQIDPGISAYGETTMSDRISQSSTAYLHRSSAWLVGGFAALALLLSVIGLYGVVAYSVSQRTREIGVRMALGAERKSVYKLILKESGGMILLGIVAGFICSIAAATLMRKLLFRVHAWDIPTLSAVAAVLAISALLASYFPARTAASVNPVEALRAE